MNPINGEAMIKNQSDMADLVPCPFCHGARLSEKSFIMAGAMRHFILCQDCLAQGPACMIDAEKTAKRAWNEAFINGAGLRTGLFLEAKLNRKIKVELLKNEIKTTKTADGLRYFRIGGLVDFGLDTIEKIKAALLAGELHYHHGVCYKKQKIKGLGRKAWNDMKYICGLLER